MLYALYQLIENKQIIKIKVVNLLLDPIRIMSVCHTHTHTHNVIASYKLSLFTFINLILLNECLLNFVKLTADCIVYLP